VIIPEKQPRTGSAQAFGAAPNTILDHIKMLDPLDPGEEIALSDKVGTIFDHYTPIDLPEEDINENCYWDKKVIREKQQLEQSVARMKAKGQSERLAQNETAISEQAAISAVRRSNSPGDGLGYYAIFR
jgi:hypothetical protein